MNGGAALRNFHERAFLAGYKERQMPMAVIVFATDADAASIDAETAARLVELGISHVAIVGDGDLAAVVIEGWSFDGDAVEGAIQALAGPNGSARALRPVAEMSLTRIA